MLAQLGHASSRAAAPPPGPGSDACFDAETSAEDRVPTRADGDRLGLRFHAHCWLLYKVTSLFLVGVSWATVAELSRRIWSVVACGNVLSAERKCKTKSYFPKWQKWNRNYYLRPSSAGKTHQTEVLNIDNDWIQVWQHQKHLEIPIYPTKKHPVLLWGSFNKILEKS